MWRALASTITAAMLFLSCHSGRGLEVSPSAHVALVRTAGLSIPLATLEVDERGCVTYQRGSYVRRRVCHAAVRREVHDGIFAADTVSEAMDDLRDGHQTMFDSDEIVLRHAGAAASLPLEDIPRHFRDWTERVDALMRRVIGRDYIPLTKLEQ